MRSQWSKKCHKICYKVSFDDFAILIDSYIFQAISFFKIYVTSRFQFYTCIFCKIELPSIITIINTYASLVYFSYFFTLILMWLWIIMLCASFQSPILIFGQCGRMNNNNIMCTKILLHQCNCFLTFSQFLHHWPNIKANNLFLSLY